MPAAALQSEEQTLKRQQDLWGLWHRCFKQLKHVLQALCRYAEGTNSVTGVDTRKSLGECLPEKLHHSSPTLSQLEWLGPKWLGMPDH